MLCLFLQKPFAPIFAKDKSTESGRELRLSKAQFCSSVLMKHGDCPDPQYIQNISKQPFKQWIGLRENLQETIENQQETIDCPIKYKVSLCFPVFFLLKS